MFQRISNFLSSGIAAGRQCSRTSIVLALLVLGLSAAVAKWNLALGVATLVWLGLITVIGLYWMRHLRATFPGAGWVFPTSFALVLLLWSLFGASLEVSSFSLSRTTARIRFEIKPEPSSHADRSASSEPAAIDPRFLNTECVVLSSAPVLGQVVRNLDLIPALSREHGFACKEEDALRFLQRSMEAKTVKDENRIELQVNGRSESDTSQRVEAIFKLYESHLKERQRLAGGPERIRAALENKTSVTKSLQARLLSNLARGVILGLFMACVACAGAAFGAWLHQPRGQRFARFMPIVLLAGVFLIIVLTIIFSTSDNRYWTTARIRLVAGKGIADPATWSAGAGLYDHTALANECGRLSSRPFQAQVLGALSNAPNPDSIHLEAVLVPQTSVVDIWASAATPAAAAEIADTAAQLALSLPMPEDKRAEPLDPAASMPRKANRSPIGQSLQTMTGPLFSFALGAGMAWVSTLRARLREAKRTRAQAMAQQALANKGS